MKINFSISNNEITKLSSILLQSDDRKHLDPCFSFFFSSFFLLRKKPPVLSRNYCSGSVSRARILVVIYSTVNLFILHTYRTHCTPTVNSIEPHHYASTQVRSKSLRTRGHRNLCLRQRIPISIGTSLTNNPE